MGTTAEKILNLARAELGEREYPPNSNKVKYNTHYYDREVSGSAYPWCAVFVWWIFQQAGVPELYYNGKKTAYCPTLLNYHKQQGQAVTGKYQPGDVIFFNFSNGTAAKHVGICESFDGTYITTIDGNTGSGNEANGGAVMRRKRHKKYIVGAYRPRYGEEPEMTKEEIRAIVRAEVESILSGENTALALGERIDELRAGLPPSDWSEKARAWAENGGVIHGDENGHMAWKKNCTREELAQILFNNLPHG